MTSVAIFLLINAAIIAGVFHQLKRSSAGMDAPWNERLAEMAEFTSDWVDCKSVDLNLLETRLDSTSIRLHGGTRFMGSLDVEVNEAHVQFFDWQTLAPCESACDIMLMHKRGQLQTKQDFMVMQTAVVFTPKRLDMAAFSVHPKRMVKDDIRFIHPMLNRGLTFQQPVATGTYFDADYQLTSIQPYLTQQVFNSEPGRTKLIPFIEEWGFTIEWTEKNLLVYKVGQLMAPEQLQDFARIVLELADLLFEADEAADQHVEERISAAVQP